MKNLFTKKIPLKVLALSLTILFVSCKKEDKKDSPIVGNWELVKFETTQNGGVWQDTNEPCKLDNSESYEKDGSWVFYEGPNKCGTGGSIIEGTWKFAANETKVIYTYSGYADEYESNVDQLTSTTLVLIHGAGDVQNTQFKQTFKKK